MIRAAAPVGARPASPVLETRATQVSPLRGTRVTGPDLRLPRSRRFGNVPVFHFMGVTGKGPAMRQPWARLWVASALLAAFAVPCGAAAPNKPPPAKPAKQAKDAKDPKKDE